MGLPVENEQELSVGGFQGIKKIKGLLTSIDVTDPPDTWENQDRQVVIVKLEDAEILEMFGGEDLFELKDRKFSFFIPYAEKGKSPHKNSIYSKCWLDSAKEQGKKPSEFIGQYPILEKQPRVLFEQYVETSQLTKNSDIVKTEDGKNKTKTRNVKGVDKEFTLVRIHAVNESGLPNHFCFAGGEEASAENVKGYIKNLVIGLNEKAALRKLLVDQKAKQHPEFKDALNGGTLAKELGLEVVDGKFAESTPSQS